MTKLEKPRFKRTQYLTAKRFQLKYVGLILLLMFSSAIICSYFVYYTAMVLMGERLASVYPQGRLMSIINSVNFSMIMLLLFMTPFVVMIGIFLSHKIAGPIYRIEKFLGDMTNGNFSSRIGLRKGDELVSMADKINILNDSLRSTIGSHKSSMGKIVAELTELKKLIDSKPANISVLEYNIVRLQNEIKELEAQLSKYKI